MGNLLRDLYDSLKRLFGDSVEMRSIKEVESWDGSAARFDTTADYCRASLINLNTGDEADWTQDRCKLPVREPGDASTVYVKQALGPAAAALAGARTPMTKPEGVSDEEWESALTSAANELISAYEQADEVAPANVYEVAGKEPPEAARAMTSGDAMEALSYKLWENQEREAFLMDVYFDNGSIYAIANSRGKLYRVPFTVMENDIELGAWEEVKHEFAPVETRSAMTIHRQADGRYRWFSQSCTAVLNRVGDIDSTELFDAFVRNLDEYGYPFRTFYHSGAAYRTGQADFVARDGYVLITSGLYDDSALAQLEIKARAANPDYWGESIGYLPLARTMYDVDGIAIPVYTDGYLQEISTLPEREAAALFTKTNQQEVQRMLKGKALQAFLKLAADAGMDEASAQAWLDSNIDATNRQITDDGLITRAQEETPETDATPDTAEAPEAVDEVTRTGKLVAAQQETLTQLVEQLGGFVQEVTARLEALEQGETQRRQAYLDDLPEQPVVNVWRPKVERADSVEEDTRTAAEKATAILKEKAQHTAKAVAA